MKNTVKTAPATVGGKEMGSRTRAILAAGLVSLIPISILAYAVWLDAHPSASPYPYGKPSSVTESRVRPVLGPTQETGIKKPTSEEEKTKEDPRAIGFEVPDGECPLTEADVRNVPEGWKPHVFKATCVAFAFPDGENITVDDLETGSDLGDSLAEIQKESTDGKTQSVVVQVFDDSQFSENIPCKAANAFYLQFCRDAIMSEWDCTKTDAISLVCRPGQEDLYGYHANRPDKAFAAIRAGHLLVTIDAMDTIEPTAEGLIQGVLETIEIWAY